MKKIIAIALALVMVFAMANVALAFEASDYTLGANSTTPARALKNISREFSLGTHLERLVVTAVNGLQ